MRMTFVRHPVLWLRARRHEKRIRRMMAVALVFFARLDRAIERAKWPTWKREQFWRDMIHSPKTRASLFAKAMKDLGIKE